ncbi:MAG: 4Fe-4S binding protein [Candidatus Aminicenantes bacterium]|jgi:NAD-dependent dihydropyrimidine dehydrogenase PreA subunit
MKILDQFVAIFGVWKEAEPYISMIVNEPEMQMIVAMQGRAMMLNEVAGLLEISPEQAYDFLERCYGRRIVDKTNKDGSTVYTPTDFATRLNHFAMFENWDDIPAADRRSIDRCFLNRFIAQHRPKVEGKMRGLSAEEALPNDTIMLLSEIEAMIDAAAHIAVLPCDCRRLGQNCSRPIETCIYLDDCALDVLDRGHGRRLAKEETKKLVRWADKKGLMHTADGHWQTRGLHAICNCCACDCYPFRAARELGSKGVWPRSRYIARHNRDQCSFCGACVQRCHFDAFYFDGSMVESKGKSKKNVRFDAEKCWGCGLCANSCPSEAILMKPL